MQAVAPENTVRCLSAVRLFKAQIECIGQCLTLCRKCLIFAKGMQEVLFLFCFLQYSKVMRTTNTACIIACSHLKIGAATLSFMLHGVYVDTLYKIWLLPALSNGVVSKCVRILYSIFVPVQKF